MDNFRAAVWHLSGNPARLREMVDTYRQVAELPDGIEGWRRDLGDAGFEPEEAELLIELIASSAKPRGFLAMLAEAHGRRSAPPSMRPSS